MQATLMGRAGADPGIFRPFRSLLSAQVIGAVLGLLFWITVARLVPAREVGVAAAAISAQTLLGIVTNLGLGTLMISELPLHGPARQRRLLLRSLMAASTAALTLSAVVVLASPVLGTNLSQALDDPLGIIFFGLGVAAASCAVITDESTLPLRKSHVQVGRNLLASSLRFPITATLLLLGFTDSHVLQICWVVPILVSIPIALRRLRLPRDHVRSPSLWQDLRAYVGPALHNQGLNLSIAAGSQLIPVVAGLTLTSVANAEFAIAWLMATFVFLPPYLLAIALFAHGANVPIEEFRKSMQTTIPASLALSLALCAGAWLLGEPLLLVFGGGYSENSYAILALLVPAGLWMVFKDHLVAFYRAQRRFSLATRLAMGAFVLELTGASVGAVTGGVRGLCLGWLAAMVVEMVVSVPWLREAFGGLKWQLPLLPSRPDTGRANVLVVGAAVVLLALVTLAGVVLVTRDTPAGRGAGAGGSPVTDTVSCQPTAERPGPLIDLGVQAAIGEDEAILLPPRTVRRLVRLADQAGASVISTAASWRDIRPREGRPYNFSGLDRVIDAARERDLMVRLQVVGTPDWALDGGAAGSQWRPPLSDAELDRWSSWVRDLMNHVDGRVEWVEVWSEPNNDEFWATGPDPEAYTRLLTRTHTAVKDVDPTVQVVTGGVSGNDIGFIEAMYDELPGGGSGRQPFDAVGVHPFTGDLTPEQVAPGRRYEREPFGLYDENFVGFRAIHTLMTERGDGDLPIYISEFGYSTTEDRGSEAVPDGLRATYLTEAFEAATCSPYVSVFSWYYLHPTPFDPASWTLLDRQLRPNKTYAALRAWSRQMERVQRDSPPTPTP